MCLPFRLLQKVYKEVHLYGSSVKVKNRSACHVHFQEITLFVSDFTKSKVVLDYVVEFTEVVMDYLGDSASIVPIQVSTSAGLQDMSSML